ncbi:MAG: mannosyltransferase [Flavobacteriaceae bacterium]|mgnify:CR=1 FL=1|nr:mannosyltransferase [Flavobacteriaceae bacterium]
MLNQLKLYRTPLLLALLCAVMYGSFAYDLVRSDFPKLITLYAGLCFLSYQLLKLQGWNFRFLVVIGIVFRLVFLLATPNLSQDFYRFLWDGQLVAQGVSPYEFTVQAFMKNPSFYGASMNLASTLHQGMGDLNASHFSNYPPVNQLFFAFAGTFMGKHIGLGILLLRLPIIMADLGILYFGRKLLKNLQFPQKNIFWYFLNPFIIIELTGNLHFEGVMLFFVVCGLYLFQKKQWLGAAAVWALSISTKLIPLLFLPLFVQWFWHRKASKSKNIFQLLAFYSLVTIITVLTFVPFVSESFLNNYVSTTALWFQNFEFNASVYYVIRWIGFQTIGWNIIESVGKILPLVVVLFILLLTFFRSNKNAKSLITAMLFAISGYFLLSTTVHPWYLATPLLLSIFTKYRFPLLWSVMVMVSYAAYGETSVEENMVWVAIEYTTVIGFALWELFFRKTTPEIPLQESQNT